MDQLKWPEAPTCHSVNPIFKLSEMHWRAPRGDEGGPYDEAYRTCSYCGSMHPEDFLKALQAGAEVDVADQKYGWPHKFYVKVPNPKAGKECKIGSSSDGPLMGTAPSTTYAKWYNEHLAELDAETFERLAVEIFKRTGIMFVMHDGALMFKRG